MIILGLNCNMAKGVSRSFSSIYHPPHKLQFYLQVVQDVKADWDVVQDVNIFFFF